MELEELYVYKNRLMKDICSNQEIVGLLTGDANTEAPNIDLAYTQVFPYEYVPETESEGSTFICFDVDIISAQKSTYTPVLYIWVFTHKSKMRMPGGGILIDKLTSELCKMLNKNRCYGMGELKLDSVRRFTPILDYLGRVSTYYAEDSNMQGTKPTPANRRVGL